MPADVLHCLFYIQLSFGIFEAVVKLCSAVFIYVVSRFTALGNNNGADALTLKILEGDADTFMGVLQLLGDNIGDRQAQSILILAILGKNANISFQPHHFAAVANADQDQASVGIKETTDFLSKRLS